jgi:hypothetical protein
MLKQYLGNYKFKTDNEKAAMKSFISQGLNDYFLPPHWRSKLMFHKNNPHQNRKYIRLPQLS